MLWFDYVLIRAAAAFSPPDIQLGFFDTEDERELGSLQSNTVRR